MPTIDYKKELKHLYAPSAKEPALVGSVHKSLSHVGGCLLELLAGARSSVC